MDINLEKDMKASADIIAYCADPVISADFYRALCHMRWKKINYRSPDEQIIDKLKGEEPDVWSCSWRYAGGIIADIRNKHHGKNEDYMDFYCVGNEGVVSPLVEKSFKKIGWEKYPWPEDNWV